MASLVAVEGRADVVTRELDSIADNPGANKTYPQLASKVSEK